MSIYERQWYRSDAPRVRPPSANPAVTGLIIANVAVFILQAIARRYMDWDPATQGLGLSPHQVVARLWLWELVTSLFLHGGVWHIAVNMFVLWMFGRHVERVMGRARFLRFYFAAGIVASMAYVASGYLSNPYVPAIGASGAVMGVLVYATMLSPNSTVLLFFVFPMKLKWVTAFVVGLDAYYFLFSPPGVSTVAHPAHLGGALLGFLYFRYGGRFDRFFTNLEEKAARTSAKKRREREVDLQKEVDRLLEKIHAGGLDSLSPKERDFLRQASRRLRDRSG